MNWLKFLGAFLYISVGFTAFGSFVEFAVKDGVTGKPVTAVTCLQSLNYCGRGDGYNPPLIDTRRRDFIRMAHGISRVIQSPSGVYRLPFADELNIYDQNITVTAAGYAPGFIFRNSSGEKRFEVLLYKGREVEGVVLNSSGQPMPYAEVNLCFQVMENSSMVRLRTDAQGRWRSLVDFDHITDLKLRLFCNNAETLCEWKEWKDPRRDPKSADSSAAIQTKVISDYVRLLYGCLLLPDGSPASRAEIYYDSTKEELWPKTDAVDGQLLYDFLRSVPAATCDKSGRFKLYITNSVKKPLFAIKDGWSLTRFFVPPSAGMKISRPLILKLSQGQALKGYVRDNRGNPLANVGITVRSHVSGSLNLFLGQSVSRADGSFEFSHMPYFDVTITASKDGYYQLNNRLIDVTDHLELLLHRERKLKVRCFDKVTGQELVGLPVNWRLWEQSYQTLEKDNCPAPFEVVLPQPIYDRMDRNGKLAMERFSLSVGVPRYRVEEKQFVLKRPEDPLPLLRFRLSPGQPGVDYFACRIVGPDNKPVAGARVSLINQYMWLLRPGGIVSDAQGKACVIKDECDVPPQLRLCDEPNGDKFVVAVHDLGFASVSAADFKDGMDLKLTPWGTVSGCWPALTVARKSNDLNFSTFRFDRSDRRRLCIQSCPKISADGKFVIDRVPAGPFCLRYGDIVRWGMVTPGGKTEIASAIDVKKAVIKVLLPPGKMAAPATKIDLKISAIRGLGEGFDGDWSDSQLFDDALDWFECPKNAVVMTALAQTDAAGFYTMHMDYKNEEGKPDIFNVLVPVQGAHYRLELRIKEDSSIVLASGRVDRSEQEIDLRRNPQLLKAINQAKSKSGEPSKPR